MNLLSHLSCTILLILTIFNFGLGCQDNPVSDDIAGSTVHVEVLPESINDLITDEIKITCTPRDLPQGTQNILFMELGKEGEHPLASLTGPTLVVGNDAKNNMQANGQIAKNLSESYLQLSIKRPFVDDVGVYCCRMFYQSEFAELKMGHVYADVTIENDDRAVVLHLLQKFSKLERYTEHLEYDLGMEKNYTKDLEKTIKQQLVDQDTKVSSRFTELETAATNQSHVIQDIVGRDSFSCAFSVFGTKPTFSAGETLVFKQFRLNVGNHYDLATGIFTTPKKGLYVFHLIVRINTGNDWHIYLKANDARMASLYAYDTKTNDQSSVSTVVSLNEGDKVWPYVAAGGTLASTSEDYTLFNGFLLQLL